MTAKKLYRSRKNRMVAGVAGGLGDYFEIDPIIFRILFIFFTFVGGSGAVLYLILLIIIPLPNDGSGRREEDMLGGNPGQEIRDGEGTSAASSVHDFVEETISAIPKQKKESLVGLTAGILMIVFGLYVLLSKIFHIDWPRFIFPLTLIACGLILLLSSKKFKGKNNA